MHIYTYTYCIYIFIAQIACVRNRRTAHRLLVCQISCDRSHQSVSGAHRHRYPRSSPTRWATWSVRSWITLAHSQLLRQRSADGVCCHQSGSTWVLPCCHWEDQECPPPVCCPVPAVATPPCPTQCCQCATEMALPARGKLWGTKANWRPNSPEGTLSVASLRFCGRPRSTKFLQSAPAFIAEKFRQPMCNFQQVNLAYSR